MRDVWKVLSKVVGTWKMLSDDSLTSCGLSERQYPHSHYHQTPLNHKELPS